MCHRYCQTTAATSVLTRISRGETPRAFVVPVEGETIDRKELIDFCRKNIANYKIPRDIEFRESLPKSAVGKVLRRLLRDETSS